MLLTEKDAVKAPPTNLRPALMRIMIATFRLIARPILPLLAVTPFIGPQIRAIRTLSTIHRLEEQGDREEARKLRNEALATTRSYYAAPLWSSRGTDLLYYKKDYAGALAAFRNAMAAFEQPEPAADYGLAQPDRVYAGAAYAAHMVGDRESAMRYYEEFSDILDHFEKSNSTWLPINLDWHRNVNAYLRQELGDLPPSTKTPT